MFVIWLVLTALGIGVQYKWTSKENSEETPGCSSLLNCCRSSSFSKSDYAWHGVNSVRSKVRDVVCLGIRSALDCFTMDGTLLQYRLAFNSTPYPCMVFNLVKRTTLTDTVGLLPRIAELSLLRTHVKISQLVNKMCSQQACSKLFNKL
jgi:hypothetical protein